MRPKSGGPIGSGGQIQWTHKSCGEKHVMMKYLVVAIMALVGTTTLAQAQSEHAWKLSKINGKAWIEVPGHETFRVKRNRYLFPGQTLSTNARTRLLLTRGKERIQVGSNTVMSLPTVKELSPGKTIIRQKAGTIHLAVNKKNVKHFSVETPFMVAAVKGTQFSISLNKDSSNIRVHEGIVEVSNRQTNEVVDITAGQSASVVKQQGTRVAQMSVYDRGEYNPDIAALAVKHENYNQQPKEGFISTTASLAMSLLTAVLGFVAGVINGTINAIAGVVTSLLSPIFSLFGFEESLSPFGQKILLAIFATIAMASSFAYWKLRKR